jgi:nitroreductase
MNVQEAICNRKSVRHYLERDVAPQDLQQILEAARMAPSASNRQEWRFIVVRSPERRRKLAIAACNQGFVAEAPVVIACCAQTDHHVMACGQPCYPIDVAIAIDHMTLMAVSLDLGTCWIGAFDEPAARDILHVPDTIRIVELLTLGYPADPSRKPKNRLPLDTLVHHERWSDREIR